MRRTAIDEFGHVVDIRDVPQDITERHRHAYTCEGCGMRLIPKKGSQQVHHFAHASNVDCDPWSQSMTAWHIAGQDVLATLGARLEVPCDKGNITHRADAVFDRNNTVVELQHSSMSLETFIERNEFYLKRFDNLIWLFDARQFAERLVIHEGDVPADGDADAGDSDGNVIHGSDDGCWVALTNKQTIRRISMPNPRNWFTLMSAAPCYWTGRGVSVALYVDGPSNFSSGHIVELFPHADAPHALSCHVWELGAWLDALTRGNLPFMRRGTVRYVLMDGHAEERVARYGSPLPRPENTRDIPWYTTRIWRMDGERVEPDSLMMPSGGIIELVEMTYVTKAGVRVWFGKRKRGRRYRPPDVDLWLPVNTPMLEVRRTIVETIGEDRAGDYDWSGFPDREMLEERVSVSLPVIEGRERFCLTVRDAETQQEIGHAWAYSETHVDEVLEIVRQSVDPIIAGLYDWVTRNGRTHMHSPMELRLHRNPDVRQVTVTVSSNLGIRLLRKVVPSSMGWDDIRRLAMREVPEADGYDWNSPPEGTLNDGRDAYEWVVRGLPRRVSVVLDGREIMGSEAPYGGDMSEVMVGLRRRVELLDERFSLTVTPKTRQVLSNSTIVLRKRLNATHPVMVLDGMSVMSAKEIAVPYWFSHLPDPSVALKDAPAPSPAWADRFAGLFVTDGNGDSVPVTNPDLSPCVSEATMMSARFLRYGYRHDGYVVFSEGEAEGIRRAKATAQTTLF